MKPIIQWVTTPGALYQMPNGTYLTGYWACRHRRGFSYKSGVGRTPSEAYNHWAHINGRDV